MPGEAYLFVAGWVIKLLILSVVGWVTCHAGSPLEAFYKRWMGRLAILAFTLILFAPFFYP